MWDFRIIWSRMICSIKIATSIPTCRVSIQSAVPVLSNRIWASHRRVSLGFALTICNSKRGKQTCLWCSQEHEGPSLTKWRVRRGWKEQCREMYKLDVLSAMHGPMASPSFPVATCVGWVLNGITDSSTPCFSCISPANAQWLHEISSFIFTPQTLQKLTNSSRAFLTLVSIFLLSKAQALSLAQNWML